MKLLFAIKRLANAAGGAERVLCTVCSGLAARGHEVYIVTFDSPGGQPFYALDARIKRIDLEIGNSLKPAGILETLKRMKALRQIALSEQPDIAIGFMHSMFIPMAFALAGTGIPTLGSEHIVPEHYRTRRFEFFLLIIATRLLKKITVLSTAIRSTYPDSVMAKMVVMPNPVHKPSDQRKKTSNENQRILLNVSRLDRQKDQATLIKAFAKIADEFPDWQLRIVGNGPLRNELEELVEESGLVNRVVLPGITSDIDSEYLAADIFVISSIYEAFGLVTAEAMSHGLPVVGFADCPGTNELVQHGTTGILVNSKKDRIKELATALSDLIKNPALQEQLGLAGIKAIDKSFSSEQVCSHWENLLISTTRTKV